MNIYLCLYIALEEFSFLKSLLERWKGPSFLNNYIIYQKKVEKYSNYCYLILFRGEFTLHAKMGILMHLMG